MLNVYILLKDKAYPPHAGKIWCNVSIAIIRVSFISLFLTKMPSIHYY